MANPPRPTVIRLGGRNFTFRFRPASAMRDNMGTCRYARAVIDVRNGQTPYDEADTVLHEVMHAILYSQGRDYQGRAEEHYVRALATGLVAVIQENPEFAWWLCYPRAL